MEWDKNVTRNVNLETGVKKCGKNLNQKSRIPEKNPKKFREIVQTGRAFQIQLSM